LNALTLVKSKKQNSYFHDQKVNSTQWCHPLLYHMLTLHQQGKDVGGWAENMAALPGDPVQIDDGGTFYKKDIAYYLEKYTLLRENGFFSGFDTLHHLGGRLSAAGIVSTLVNTRQVTFEVLDYCNLNCAYCTYGKFYENYDRREKNKMNPGVARTFLKYLVELMDSPLNPSHDRPVNIGFYGGEPLLNMSFIREIVAYVRQLKTAHNRFVFNMTTNGLLLERHMDFLVEHDFSLLISLDGDEKSNSYRVYHDGAPAYEEILKNIDALKSKYPDYFESRVDFNAVFHNRNSVAGLHDYFKSRFDKFPAISELNSGGIRDSMRREFWETYANVEADLSAMEDYSLIEKEMFTRLPGIRQVSTFIDQCSGFVFNDYNDLLAAVNDGKAAIAGQDKGHVRLPTGTCVPFARKVFITVNGKLLPCEHIGHRFSLGHVDEQAVHLDFEQIAETYNGYYDRLQNQCGICANSEACLQCVFYLDLEQPRPVCSGCLTKKEYAAYLSTQLSYLEENPKSYMKIMKEVRLE
jgi:uncharacterized protein